MSQLCSIRYDISVTLHIPGAHGQCSAFDHNGGLHYMLFVPYAFMTANGLYGSLFRITMVNMHLLYF